MYWVDKPRWVEVSLTVSNEQAEAVSEVLNRYLSNGVVVEIKAESNNHGEANYLEPFARVFGYLLADASLEEKKKQLEEALWHLGQIQPLPVAHYRPIRDEDWMSSWKKNYHPMKIGRQLIIVPAWLEKEFPGRIVIRINPGMAFGTGTHPSTQLCLQLLENTLRLNQSAIDIGCGSGILSIAALKLGATHVLAVDIDPPAIASTQENAAYNKIKSRLEIGLGSVSEILNGQFTIRSAQVVVVNILSSIIIRLFNDGLGNLVEENGHLILAGILESQAQEIIDIASINGFTLQKTIKSSDWVSLLLFKE
jgi:ribosomal protein L11 methyltransferase